MRKKGKSINPEFDKKWLLYKETVEQLKSLEANFTKHLERTRDYVQSCSKIGVQVGHFFKTSDAKVSTRTTLFGQVNSSQIEFNTFKAIEKLYQEQILQPMQVLWVMDKENHKLVKERKKMIKTQNSKHKAWQSKVTEKGSIEKELLLERQTGKEKKRLFGQKRKSITEVNRELLDRKRNFEEAKENQEKLTELIVKKFDSLFTAKQNGELLGDAVSGILSCQLQLAASTLNFMKDVKEKFKQVDVFQRTLGKYENAAKNGYSLDQQPNLTQGFVFGRMLTSQTPDIVCDCISYIKAGIGAEGIFRIPGNRTNVEVISKSYDKNEKHILNSRDDIDIHDVCSTLKYYFNTLPEPLIPYSCYEELESYFDNDRTDAQGEERIIISIINKIPDPYIGVLGLLLNFLHDVARNHKSNQMTSANIATCFAPVLLKPRPDPTSKNKAIESLKSMKNIAATIATVTILIDNARQFKIPPKDELKSHTNITTKTKEKVQRAYMHNIKAVTVAPFPLPREKERGPPPSPPAKNVKPPPGGANRKAIEISFNDLEALQSKPEDPANVLSSENKKRGFLRRESQENEDVLRSRPAPPPVPLGTRPSGGGGEDMPPGLSLPAPRSTPKPPPEDMLPPRLSPQHKKPVDTDIPAALLGAPGTIPALLGTRKTADSIDGEL